VAGILATVVCTALVLARNRSPDVERIGLALFAVLLLGLLPIEVGVVLARVSSRWTNASALHVQRISTWIWIALLIGVLIWSLTLSDFRRALPWALLVGQLGLAALYVSLYPVRLVTPDGESLRYSVTRWLPILLGALIAWSVVDTLRRFWRQRGGEQPKPLLSPIALFGLLLALHLPGTETPQVKPDDYHFGELLLGWWSWARHGLTPYVGYYPPHGLLEDGLIGMVASTFLDGTAGAFIEANRLAFVIVGLPAFLSLNAMTGSLVLSFTSTLLLGARLGWFFLTPFLCLFHGIDGTLRPTRWLTVWLIAAPVLLLAIPSQGLSLVLATTPLAGWIAFRLLRRGPLPRNFRWGLGLGAVAALAAVVLTPVGPMLRGALGYVLENGPINQTAYGVPWHNSWEPGSQVSAWLEAVRTSWVAVLALAALGLVAAFRDRERFMVRAAPALTALLYSLLMIPYSMGRIDVAGISRPGIFSAFGWLILVPVFAWKFLDAGRRLGFFFGLAAMGAMLGVNRPSYSKLLSELAPSTKTKPLHDGPAAGLKNLGRSAASDEHWTQLLRLNDVLRRHLSDAQTYLDLTSQNARYFYLDRRPATAVTAPYNLAPVAQQKREAAALAETLPPLAVLDFGNNVHDGGGLALRSPILYRFVLDHYAPRMEDGIMVGLPRSGPPESAPEAELALFDQVFAVPDLQLIPVAWGRSWSSLKKRSVEVRSLEKVPTRWEGDKVIWDISGLSLEGRDAGLLTFRFRCDGPNGMARMRVQWRGDGQEAFGPTAISRFEAREGQLVVPLDAYPRWALLKQPRALLLALEPADACKHWEVDDAALAQRTSLLGSNAR
jgi:hypothetical protein